MPESDNEQCVWVIAESSGSSFEARIHEVWDEDDEDKAHERAEEIRDRSEPEDHITCSLQKVRSLQPGNDQEELQ